MLVTLKNDPEQKLLAMKTLRKAALIKRNQLARPGRVRKADSDRSRASSFDSS